jgi:hypothetical protein
MRTCLTRQVTRDTGSAEQSHAGKGVNLTLTRNYRTRLDRQNVSGDWKLAKYCWFAAFTSHKFPGAGIKQAEVPSVLSRCRWLFNGRVVWVRAADSSF